MYPEAYTTEALSEDSPASDWKQPESRSWFILIYSQTTLIKIISDSPLLGRPTPISCLHTQLQSQYPWAHEQSCRCNPYQKGRQKDLGSQRMHLAWWWYKYLPCPANWYHSSECFLTLVSVACLTFNIPCACHLPSSSDLQHTWLQALDSEMLSPRQILTSAFCLSLWLSEKYWPEVHFGPTWPQVLTTLSLGQESGKIQIQGLFPAALIRIKL